MIYDVNDPDSLYWTFLHFGRKGRYLSEKDEAKQGGRGGGDGNFGGGDY